MTTAKKLNQRISSFNYGPDFGNKPSPIDHSHITSGHFKQSGKVMNTCTYTLQNNKSASVI